MNEEILHRVMQVVIYTGGIVAFWQITKHMPKALYTLLECISVMACSVLLLTPIAMIIEYILGGNIHTTMMFVGCLVFGWLWYNHLESYKERSNTNMLFSKQGFKTVDTTEEFVKQVMEFGQKDIVLSVTHSNGVIDIVVSPTMDAIEADVYHFLNDETELKYTMPIKSLTASYISSLSLTSAIHTYLSEAFKVADIFARTTRQSTDYAK